MVKIPEPMTAPMPSEVRLRQPRDFFNRISAFSESANSWSILLQRKSCDATHVLRSRPQSRRSEVAPDYSEEVRRDSMYPEMLGCATCCREVCPNCSQCKHGSGAIYRAIAKFRSVVEKGRSMLRPTNENRLSGLLELGI